MKSKIFTLTMLFAFAMSVSAQTVLFEEDFESSALIPETFTLINNDGFTPNEGDEMWTDSAWTVVTSSRPELEGTQVAAALSYYTDMGDATADDWMILPAITLGSASTLSWDAMSLTSSGNYPDDYQVIIAEVDAGNDPTVDYMFSNGTILLDQDAEWCSAAVSNPGEGLHHHEIDLSDYAGQEVWIAFRQNTGNGGGYLIAVDNIMVEEGSSTGILNIENNQTFTVYPNPTQEIANIRFNADEIANGSISVYDITGRMVKEMNLTNLAIGRNNVEFNVSDLQTGTYIVTLTLNNKVTTQKLMVQ
jgi:hypothetical protein